MDRFIAKLDDDLSVTIAHWYLSSRLATELAGVPRNEVFGKYRGLHNHSAFEAYRVKAQALVDSGSTVSTLVEEVLETEVLGGYIIDDEVQPRPGDIVLDVGSFNGNNAIQFAKMVGETGHVFTFEPVPEQFKTVCANCAPYKNITPVNMAVGEREGAIKFEVMGSASREVAASAGTGDKTVVDVAMTTLDAFVASRKLSKVDFLKMDIEGAELPALKGAQKVMRNYRPTCMLAAYHLAHDLFEFPRLIDHTELWYKFKLRHYHWMPRELVLFAIPKKQSIPTAFR